MTASLPRSPSADPVDLVHEAWVAHGYPAAADGASAAIALLRFQRQLQTRLDGVLRRFDITFARYEILALLALSENGSASMTVLATRLQVHPTSVSNAVNRLTRSNLITRVVDSADRRVVRATITDRGTTLASAATAALNTEVFEEIGTGSADLATLLRVLRSLRLGAGDFHP